MRIEHKEIKLPKGVYMKTPYKVVKVWITVEKGDNLGDYKEGEIINLPGEYSYSDILGDFTKSTQDCINDFIEKLKR